MISMNGYIVARKFQIPFSSYIDKVFRYWEAEIGEIFIKFLLQTVMKIKFPINEFICILEDFEFFNF